MSLLVLMKFMVAIYLVIQGVFRKDELEIGSFFREKNINKYICFIVFTSLKDPILLIILLNLLAFHIWLKIKGLTTYQYLVNQKNKAKKVNVALRSNREMKKDPKKPEKSARNFDSQAKSGFEGVPNLGENNENPILIPDSKQEPFSFTGNTDEFILRLTEQPSLTKPQEKEKKAEIFQQVIPEESELNYTKESVRIDERLANNVLAEVKIKKPLLAQQSQTPKKKIDSHRSGDLNSHDEESLNLSDNMRGMKTFDEEFKLTKP